MGIMFETREGSWDQVVASRTPEFTCTVFDCAVNDLQKIVRDFSTNESFEKSGESF